MLLLTMLQNMAHVVMQSNGNQTACTYNTMADAVALHVNDTLYWYHAKQLHVIAYGAAATLHLHAQIVGSEKGGLLKGNRKEHVTLAEGRFV